MAKVQRRRTSLWSILFLGVLLTACSMTSDSPEPGQPGVEGGDPQAGRKPAALVLGEANSPILNELQSKVRLVHHNGSQDAADYGLVIFDGDAHTPEAIGGHEIIADALRQEKWVLGLDLTGAHKKEGLGKHLAFASMIDSPGYLVRTARDRNERPNVIVLEYAVEGRAFGDVTDGLGLQAASGSRLYPDATKAFVASVMKKLKGGGLSAQQKGDDPPLIPAGLLFKAFYYEQPASWTAGNAGRKNGSQSIYFQMNHTFYVFLENSGHPQGNFQWVVAEIEGQANPTADTGRFLNMAKDEKAWWQDRLKFRVRPSGDHAGSFSSYRTSPQTENGKTQVTSGTSFTIGYEAPKSPSASFTYSNPQTRDIPDWKITNNSSGILAAWDYRSANPDADKTYGCGEWTWSSCNGFNKSNLYPTEPPSLSKGNMQAHAQVIWKSNRVLTDWVTVDTTSEQHVADTYCSFNFGPTCYGWEDTRQKRGYWQLNVPLSINMAAVVPIPIQSVTFGPNPVTAGDTVTGTVTLQSAAQVPTVIDLSSNSQNATVLPTVTVEHGQTSANFEVLTNANGIAEGKSTVATITAFYAQGYQTQLTIKNPVPSE